jgi:hypothetical protein
MTCAHSSLLDAYAHDKLAQHDRDALLAHARQCARCGSALAAVRALRAVSEEHAPSPAEGLLSRVAGVAARQHCEPRSPLLQSNRFWMGAGLGSSLAAGILLTLGWFGGGIANLGSVEPPQLIALHGMRDVNVVIDSPADIAQAEIRIVISGDLSVNGYESSNELRWSARLDRGVNLLTLPVIMGSPTGGHLLVEVAYGSERKTFAVLVRDEADASVDPSRTSLAGFAA